jgi:hypothetical protein
MKLTQGLHLTYCTNVHRGESWAETFANLQHYSLVVREQVCPAEPYGIGLRLSALAAQELSDRPTLLAFQHWLAANDCYVFTLNGFPYGPFHGTQVKEHVFLPDWADPERLAYTNLLFDLLGKLVPEGSEGSVSTVPGSFKAFVRDQAQVAAMREQLWRCAAHAARVSERCGRKLHLGLEPEPLGFVETCEEAVRFIRSIRSKHPVSTWLLDHLGVNYDTCHSAVEFEEPREALAMFQQHQIKLSKVQLSSALKARPFEEARWLLAAFHDHVYLHQVVARGADGALRRFRDLNEALAQATHCEPEDEEQWRIHFHVPLYGRKLVCPDPSPGQEQVGLDDTFQRVGIGTTSEQVLKTLDYLRLHPGLCHHLEMETYTWEVLPPDLRVRSVTEQIVAEYEWVLKQLAHRGIKPLPV